MRVKFTEAALRYAGELGWPVFPIAHGSKVPAIKGGAGVKDATVDADQIRAWGRAYPNANIAIACGKPSGIVVVDVDPRNGGDASIRVLAAKGYAFPPTPRARTGNKGWHLVLRHPPIGSPEISNSKGKLGPGIEVKSSAGYVLVAPSWTRKSDDGPGGHYTWEASPFDLAIPRMPLWLTTILAPPPARPRSAFTTGARGGNLEGPVACVARTPNGSRNNVLFWASCRAGELVAENLISEQSAIARLTDAANAAGLTGDDAPKAQRTIQSGLRTGRNDGGRL
jgi:hypothetical protein